MTRPQQQLIVFGVLLVVMVAVYTTAFRPRAPEPTSGRVAVAEAPTVPPGQEATIAIAQPSQQREAQRQRVLLLAWRRDPFTRGAGIGEVSGLTLTGILWDPNEPIAVINGQTVQVGDEVDGYQIVAISHDRVSLTDGTPTLQLSISP